jgi:arsenate reductase
LQLLEEQAASPQVVEYLKTPPDADTLSDLLDMLGLEPRELMRKREKEYEDSGADNPDLSRDQLIQLMVQYPKLIERPIVVSNGKAAIGRPPESVLDIL